MADTNAYCIEVCAEVRYWEDADVNGVDDTDGTLIPFRVGNLWKPLIRLSDGYIIGWPEGTTASIHYKVCDQGEYWLTDESQERIAKWKGDYVPDEFLCHGNQGYGDYIIFKVGADGKIAGWTLPDIVDKEWVLLPVDNDDLAQVMKAHPTRVTAAGVALLQQEIERLQATPLPADAALIESLESWSERADMPLAAIGTMQKAAARLRALSQPTAPVVSGQNPVAYGAVFNGRWMANVCRGSLSAAIAQGGINTEIIPLVPQSATQPATVAQVPEPINAVYFDVPAQPKSAYVMGWNDCIESMLSAAPSAKGGEG